MSGCLHVSEFDCAIVAEAEYVLNTECPHCYSNHRINQPEKLIDIDHKGIVGELMMCLTCENSFMVIGYPMLHALNPIMLDWSVRRKLEV